MKAKLIFLVTLLLFLKAHAQQGFQIGTTTTLNGSFILHQNNFETLNGTPVSQNASLAYKYTWGYNAGIQAGYNFNERYSIVTSLTYNKSGQHYDDVFHPLASDEPYHVVRKLDLTYLQLPLFFKYNFGPYGKRVQAYVMTGPEFGYLLMPAEEIWINGVQKTNILPAGEKVRNFDAGWGLGTGVDVYIRKDLYFEGGLLGYVGYTDLNSGFIKDENWFGDNNVKYHASYNFHPGIDIGFHFLFNKEAHNPFYKKEGRPILPGQEE